MNSSQGIAPLDNATTVSAPALWARSQLKSVANLTQYAPSATNILLAGPRLGMKVGSLLFRLPSLVDGVIGSPRGQTAIPEVTALDEPGLMTTATAVSAGMTQTTATTMQNTMDNSSGLGSRISLESGRSFGNMVAYATSRWSLGCFLMAIIVNRTQVYASTRRPLSLGPHIRLALRIIPIILFAMQAKWFLQSMQCQTSPDFGMLRWGNATKSSKLMYTQNGGPLHALSSVLLLGASDADSCQAVRMVPPKQESINAAASTETLNLRGSLALLWPMFQTLSLSQFIETLSCTLQGRHPTSETSMTLFEQSLAFAEADVVVSSSLGLGPFGTASSTQNSGMFAKAIADLFNNSETENKIAETAITRSMLMRMLNTPPEVLLVGLLSIMSHITSHVLGIFGCQHRFRLASTAFWGLCFMVAIAGSVFSYSADGGSDQSLHRFPTVCIIGFLPHVLILLGIIICACVYCLAVLLSSLALPASLRAQRGSFLQNLAISHENMQASVPLSNIRVRMHMDFYSALLKVGFSALTMASEAVYLNESSEVSIKQRTWLEDDRLKEAEEIGAHWLGPNFRRGMEDDAGTFLGRNSSKDQSPMISGYAREHTALDGSKIRSSEKMVRDGVGATERSGRWIMASELLLGILRLLFSWCVVMSLKVLSRFGVRTPPRWVSWLFRIKEEDQSVSAKGGEKYTGTLDFWLLNKQGDLTLPPDEHIDVESEMRRRLQRDRSQWSAQDEQQLDTSLYGWWLGGGWWGADDNSGQFIPRDNELEDDATSMVSVSDVPSDKEWESESEDDGQRTPTQASPSSRPDPASFNDAPLSSIELAQLLHPQTLEQRAEAKALAAHLTSDTIMTRSAYRDINQRDRGKVLTSTRQRPRHLRGLAKLSAEEEEEVLEHVLISRRSSGVAARAEAAYTSQFEDASGSEEAGPVCVVCQCAPRCIIVWPCRCLSLCDDCRVTLAMNNFDKCVCCRGDVASFSRIFVP